MNIDEIRQMFRPAIDEIISKCEVTDGFVDKDQFRVYIATVWGNAVLDPARSGLTEDDLEALHVFFNEEVADVLGDGETVTTLYEYLLGKQGEEAMERLQVSARHREFVAYFGRLVLTAVE